MTPKQELFSAGQALVEALWADQIVLTPLAQAAVDRMARALSTSEMPIEPNAIKQPLAGAA